MRARVPGASRRCRRSGHRSAQTVVGRGKNRCGGCGGGGRGARRAAGCGVAQREASRPSDCRSVLARLQRARGAIGDARSSAGRSTEWMRDRLRAEPRDVLIAGHFPISRACYLRSSAKVVPARARFRSTASWLSRLRMMGRTGGRTGESSRLRELQQQSPLVQHDAKREPPEVEAPDVHAETVRSLVRVQRA